MKYLVIKEEKKLTVARIFSQRAMSIPAKLHTTFQESMKRALKDLERNTLPLRFIRLNDAKLNIWILKKENLTL